MKNGHTCWEYLGKATPTSSGKERYMFFKKLLATIQAIEAYIYSMEIACCFNKVAFP